MRFRRSFRFVAALAVREMTGQELADELGLTLTTTLHHLASLREAQLVESGGRRRPYQLRRDTIVAYGDQLSELASRHRRQRG